MGELVKTGIALLVGAIAGSLFTIMVSRTDEDELLVTVWADRARESKRIAEAVVHRNGSGWTGEDNGFSVDRVRVKSLRK